MRNSFFQGVGGVLSGDIAVPDHAEELAFYSSVLTTGEAPLWRQDLMNNQGMPIIGLGERTPEYEALPLQWMPHFQVADVAASAAKAVELGGQELMHGKDDGGRSQWAVLVDPVGGAFGVIPVVEADLGGAVDLATVGHIAWLSLVVQDVASVSRFYAQVIGWAPMAAAEGAADMQRPDGGFTADILPVDHQARSIPALWLLSLPVGDLAESLQRVRAAGGELVRELSAGAPAVARDPVGVYFALQAP